MVLKRIAIRALVILTVVVVLCMFFGQTILTLTTPKVTLVEAQTGKLEEKIRITAELYFEQPDSITFSDAQEQPVTVEKVFVRDGDQVKAGDIIFTSKLGEKYDEAVKTQTEALQKEQEAQLAVDMNTGKVSTKNKTKNDAEDLYYLAQNDYLNYMGELIELTVQRGITLNDDVDTWGQQIGDKLTAEISLKLDELNVYKQKVADARAAFMKIHKKGKVKDTTYEFVKKKREAAQKVMKERDKLIKLIEQGEALKTVRAEKDGTVLAISVKAGEVYAGDKPAFQISNEQPLLRADVTEIRKTIAPDMRVDYQMDYETIKTKVLSVKRETGNKKYAIIELTDELMSALGGINELNGQPVELKIQYKAKTNTTLLPISAVQGVENGYYVFVAEQKYAMWGMQMVARKVDVRVIDHSDRMYAIEEDLSYQKIITQPSGHIEDGSRVMEYQQ